MKILVSGGAGFIGSHLCDKLIEAGHEVVCVDSFITGTPGNVSHLKESHEFTLIEHDISGALGALVEQIPGGVESLEVIYNLASPASPIDYGELPLQTLWVNAAGTKNMLDLAAKSGATFIQASTSEVYGDPLEHPQTESYFGNSNPVGARSCYNEGKRYAESLCINYRNQFQFPMKIVRIFNTYGPRMRLHDGRVIPEFIGHALAGEPLRVCGDGKQTRSFCYIDDMISGLIGVLSTSESFTGPVNIGNPDEKSISQLAENILKLTESESLISFVDMPDDDPIRRCPDIGLAKSTFGFEPTVTLEEGLKKTITYYKNS